MASRPSLFLRVLQAIIHRVWTVLFFLTAFSLACVANHWWDRLVHGYSVLAGWIMAGVDLVRQLTGP